MPRGAVPPVPEDAQVNAEEWDQFFEFFGHARVRRAIRVLSRLPSAPRCEACGSPFGGWAGALMRHTGKGPSRKNPRWCSMCFEHAPDGGMTLTIGVLFADVRGSTALAEHLPPEAVATTMNRFYSDVTRVIVRHGIVDKLIGDEVMGLYFAPLAEEGRYVDAMVADAFDIQRSIADTRGDGPQLEIGIGLAVGPAFVGMVGEGEVRDFTAIGDVVNVAARLQESAGPGEVAMPCSVADTAGVVGGETVELTLKGREVPLAARVVSLPL